MTNDYEIVVWLGALQRYLSTPTRGTKTFCKALITELDTMPAPTKQALERYLTGAITDDDDELWTEVLIKLTGTEYNEH